MMGKGEHRSRLKLATTNRNVAKAHTYGNSLLYYLQYYDNHFIVQYEDLLVS